MIFEYDIKSPQDLGLIMRARRKEQKFSQQEFADFCGVGRRFVSECESGKPRLEFGKLLQVLHGLGIDLVAKPRP